MVTGPLKNKIDALRQTLWNGGISNPVTVVEQLTYLIFLYLLDQKELETEAMEAMGVPGEKHIFPASPTGQSMRWSRFRDRHPQEICRVISTLCFPAMREINQKSMHF